jgi:hypothetical protein
MENVANLLSHDQIEKLAPDQASLSAALKLAKPANWPARMRDEGEPLLWGECQGSGSAPYRIVVLATAGEVAYKCTCPSRKLPCKHVLALMLIAADATDSFPRSSPPDWVLDWQGRRGRRRSPPPRAAADLAPAASTSLAEAIASVDRAEDLSLDPKVAARSEAQRQRLKEEREADILAGLDELERWLADQVSLGLAGFAKRAGEGVRTLSKRLVDRKAPGLANRLDMLVADLFKTPEAGREDLVIERLAGLALIAAAYRNQDRLLSGLREDVRRAVGWSMRREELLADPSAPRVASTWSVIATRSSVQPNALRRFDTWLLDAIPPAGSIRFALLTDYVPVSARDAEAPFASGAVLSAEIVYYPSAAPLRAQIATQARADTPGIWPMLPAGLGQGLAACEAALAKKPWIEGWPFAADDVTVVPLSSNRFALTDETGALLPLETRQSENVLPLLGVGAVGALATWDGRSANLLAAKTSIGHWYER